MKNDMRQTIQHIIDAIGRVIKYGVLRQPRHYEWTTGQEAHND